MFLIFNFKRINMSIDLIKNYTSNIEQEMFDKKRILDAYDKYGKELFYRENEMMHFTSSSMIINKNRDKVLMVYHNIYDSYSWTGGHNDGDMNFLNVALKEAKEETSLSELKVLSDCPCSIEVLPVKAHVKRGKYVGAHLHLNVSFLFEADENAYVHIKEDENSRIKWIPIKDLGKYISISDIEMLNVYRKILRNYL